MTFNTFSFTLQYSWIQNTCIVALCHNRLILFCKCLLLTHFFLKPSLLTLKEYTVSLKLLLSHKVCLSMTLSVSQNWCYITDILCYLTTKILMCPSVLLCPLTQIHWQPGQRLFWLRFYASVLIWLESRLVNKGITKTDKRLLQVHITHTHTHTHLGIKMKNFWGSKKSGTKKSAQRPCCDNTYEHLGHKLINWVI